MSFIDDLAYRSPVPGGGSAAAHCAACGVALIFKVMNVWRAQSNCADVASVDRTGVYLEELLETFSELEDKDACAYLRFSEARRKGEGPLVESVVLASLAPPLAVMERCLETLRLLSPSTGQSPLFLRADLLVGIELLGAAYNGARHIVRSNMRFLAGRETIDHLESRISEDGFTFGALRQTILESLSGRSRF